MFTLRRLSRQLARRFAGGVVHFFMAGALIVFSFPSSADTRAQRSLGERTMETNEIDDNAKELRSIANEA
jgi:hypothetical protein